MTLVNPFGALALEETQSDISDALDSLQLVLSILSNQLAPLIPNQLGQLRVSVDNTIAAITTLATVTNVASLANTVAVGGQNAGYDQYGQMMQGPNSLRNQIQVS